MEFSLKQFNDFFATYQQRFIHFAYTYTHEQTSAEDIVIDAIIKFWENHDQLNPDTNVPAYVLTIIKNRCIDWLRHQQSIQILSKDDDEGMNKIDAWELNFRLTSLDQFEPNQLYTQEIREIVEKTLSTLPTQTRRIFEMSRYENKSHKEIANLLGITTKSVEFHISKTAKALRIALQDYLPFTALLLFLK